VAGSVIVTQQQGDLLDGGHGSIGLHHADMRSIMFMRNDLCGCGDPEQESGKK
jgi:hypothetical protein